MWKKAGSWAIQGLMEIGFKDNSDLLMALSSQGRGIFDCIKNEKIAREPSDYYMESWDASTGLVDGFGILKNEKIQCGGFEAPDILNKITADGWQIVIKDEMKPDWKDRNSIAQVMYFQHEATKHLIEVDFFHYGIQRGYGFSDTGKTFVLATSSNLTIWNRVKIDNNENKRKSSISKLRNWLLGNYK